MYVYRGPRRSWPWRAPRTGLGSRIELAPSPGITLVCRLVAQLPPLSRPAACAPSSARPLLTAPTAALRAPVRGSPTDTRHLVPQIAATL